MKVLFLKDIKNVGQKGMVKEVSDGYALNSLIPSGVAVQATPDRVKAFEAQQAQHKADQKTREVMAESLLKRLDGETFRINADANDKGRLYKRITMDIVAAEVQKATGESIPSTAFSAQEHIHATGEHSVEITLERAQAKILVAVTKG